MKNLELFMNMIESMEGLDVSLKIGKDSKSSRNYSRCTISFRRI